MTYTVIARDSKTGQLGIGIATYSLAVGASCPFVRPGVGAVSTQAATFAAHGPRLLDLLEEGLEADKAIEVLRSEDEHFEYRQIGVVTAQGQTLAHTGSMTRSWAGAISGDGSLVIGNVLAGEHVLEAMDQALHKHSSAGLAGRLITALEAGRDAGGQRGRDHKTLPERSAAAMVFGIYQHPVIDLRVDDHSDAVSELRRIFNRFEVAAPYYDSRASNPESTPSQDEWMADNDLE